MAESTGGDVSSKIRNFEKNNYKKAKNVVPPKSKIKDKINKFNELNQENAGPKLKKGKSKRTSQGINKRAKLMQKRAALPIPPKVAPVAVPLGMIILKVPTKPNLNYDTYCRLQKHSELKMSNRWELLFPKMPNFTLNEKFLENFVLIFAKDNTECFLFCN